MYPQQRTDLSDENPATGSHQAFTTVSPWAIVDQLAYSDQPAGT